MSDIWGFTVPMIAMQHHKKLSSRFPKSFFSSHTLFAQLISQCKFINYNQTQEINQFRFLISSSFPSLVSIGFALYTDILYMWVDDDDPIYLYLLLGKVLIILDSWLWYLAFLFYSVLVICSPSNVWSEMLQFNSNLGKNWVVVWDRTNFEKGCKISKYWYIA